MRKIYLSFLLLFVVTFTFAQTIEDALFDLAGLKFTKVSDDKYECFIKQPIDHNNPDKGTFYQRLELTHVGFDAPNVMNTQGYQLNRSRNEVAMILNANYINVEHRYCGKSVPEPLDWQYLNLEQATADLHAINQLFKQIYTGKWVSTGISKGGQTTIFYRYFYPEDVDVSFPYVAPLNLEFEEKRIYKFLDTIGTAECREQIFQVQKRLLENRAEVVGKLKWFAAGAGYQFDYLGGIEAAFEYAVLEYPFSFWQWGNDCNDLPKGDTLDNYIQSLMDIVGLSFYDDRSMKMFGPHYYQASAQMGYYGFETKQFGDLIQTVGKHPHASFAPKAAGDITFDNAVPKATAKWLKKNGNRFIYINGANDTWSATRVIPTDNVEALYYNMAGKHHGNARIKNLTKAQKEELKTTLEKWLGVEVDMTVLE